MNRRGIYNESTQYVIVRLVWFYKPNFDTKRFDKRYESFFVENVRTDAHGQELPTSEKAGIGQK